MPKGAVYGFSGRNGAGKSTTQRMVCGLAYATAILGNPELLVLDEPINGLDQEGIVEFRQIIEKLHKEKWVTIFISSALVEQITAEELEAKRILSIGGFNVQEIFLHQQDLEEYFLKLMGGTSND